MKKNRERGSTRSNGCLKGVAPQTDLRPAIDVRMRVAGALVLAVCALWSCASFAGRADTKQQEEAETPAKRPQGTRGESSGKRKRDFVVALARVLKLGFAQGDKTATEACAALLFCENNDVIAGAYYAMVDSPRAPNRQVLDAALKRLGSSRTCMGDRGATARYSALQNLARALNDGHAYLTIAVHCLDSPVDKVRSGGVNAVTAASDHLEKEFAQVKQLPQLSLVEDFKRIDRMSRARELWITWLAQADREHVRKVVNRMFEEQRKRAGEALRPTGMLREADEDRP